MAPIHIGIVATFALIPLWYRLPFTPPLLTPLYVSRFLLLLPMLWTIAWWLVAGLPGFYQLRKDDRRFWALGLLLVSLWSATSTRWAFMRASHPEVGQSSAVQFCVAAIFAVVIASIRPKARHIAGILLFGVSWNSILIFLQVTRQAAVGLTALGEFPISPNSPGFSVLLAGDIRWLRPYGLLSHPNTLAGFMAVGLLAGGSFILSGSRGGWIATLFVSMAGFWALLLTFSRAAWGGLTAGILIALALILARPRKQQSDWRRIRTVMLTFLTLATIFAFTYWPILAARAGVGEERVELRSIADRIVFQRFAERAITENPLVGIGAGNFPWRTAYYLAETDYDLRGDNVHNIYLLAWAELGTIGFTILLYTLFASVVLIWRRVRDGRVSSSELLLFSGFVALAAVGLLDHYPWTLIQFQTLWWGILATSFGAPRKAI
jgi:O-antigen ligase